MTIQILIIFKHAYSKLAIQIFNAIFNCVAIGNVKRYDASSLVLSPTSSVNFFSNTFLLFLNNM